MNTAIKSIYLITALSLSTLAAYADNANDSATKMSTSSTISNTAPVVTGTYQCQRMDSSNKTMNYALTVTKSHDTYTFEWDDSTGNPALYGTGVIHPNMPNVISTSFWDPAKPETIGIEMFQAQPDGSLQASWVLQTENQLGSETCAKSK